jgi:hypothetical protein
MQQITRMYWVMANDGTLPFPSPEVFESYMAGPGQTNLETGLPGVVHGIDAGTQEHDDFMNYALHESSKTPAAQKADWASYGYGAGSLWSDSGDSSATAPAPSTPASAQAPAAMPAFQTSEGGSVQQPSTMELGFGDRDITVTGITWTNWGTSSAQGSGSATTTNCTPNCAQGSPITEQWSLSLSQPVNGVFTSMSTTEASPGQSPYTFTWSYPSNWAMNAS